MQVQSEMKKEIYFLFPLHSSTVDVL